MNRNSSFIAGIGGYLVDLADLARGRAINFHSYMKFLSLNALRKETGARCLIETGTYLGTTSARCARVFDKVLTIELDPKLAEQAAKRLRTHRNVEVFLGDAVTILPTLLEREDAKDSIVFLDGHFSGGETALGDVADPAVQEIAVLGAHADKICGIIIDDFRLFGEEEGFPTKSELFTAVEKYFPASGFATLAHPDQLIIARRKQV